MSLQTEVLSNVKVVSQTDLSSLVLDISDLNESDVDPLSDSDDDVYQDASEAPDNVDCEFHDDGDIFSDCEEEQTFYSSFKFGKHLAS
jgi:hypothetical protein